MNIPARERRECLLGQALSWAFLLPSLALIWNAAGINEPAGDTGPMAVDYSPLLELLSLPAGLVLLWFGACADRRFPRWGFLGAAVVLAVPAARNFYAYPPFMDGAYFMGRYGRDSEMWPADTISHAIAASGFIAALYGFITFGSRPLPAHRYRRTVTAVAVLACSLVFTILLDRAAHVQMFGRSISLFLLIPLLTGGVSLLWIRRSRAALVILLYSTVFFVMIGALPILFEL